MANNRQSGLLTLCTLALALGACDEQPIAGLTRDAGTLDPATSTSATAVATELPRTFLDTRHVPPTGTTIRVPAGGDLQGAIDRARPGDQIVLQAGATYTGNFLLRSKSGSGWIVIRSSGNLPPEGTRITPADRSQLARIQSPKALSAIRTQSGAHHYRLVGLEITVAPHVTSTYDLVAFRPGAHHLILDRSFVHGNSRVDFQRCVQLNAASSAIIDSFLGGCHSKRYDSQAIAVWNTNGPLKIANNYLAGAGENLMIGGATPKSGVMPADIEIRRNHFRKPPAWRDKWIIKNLFEVKFGRRILLEGNLFESNWAAAQNGNALLIKSQNGSCTWCETADITFRNNVVRDSDAGMTITKVTRMVIENNLFDEIGERGNGRLLTTLGGITDLRIEHNTGFSRSTNVMMDGSPQSRFVMRNNLIRRAGTGVQGSGKAEGKGTLAHYTPGYVFKGNVLIGAEESRYPTGNFFPSTPSAVRFVDYAGGNYRLRGDSRFKRRATDGTDPGANIDALEAATAGVEWRR